MIAIKRKFQNTCMNDATVTELEGIFYIIPCMKERSFRYTKVCFFKNLTFQSMKKRFLYFKKSPGKFPLDHFSKSVGSITKNKKFFPFKDKSLLANEKYDVFWESIKVHRLFDYRFQNTCPIITAAIRK